MIDFISYNLRTVFESDFSELGGKKPNVFLEKKLPISATVCCM
jgi:hypothetical protein